MSITEGYFWIGGEPTYKIEVKMNIVICVATKDQKRIEGFLDEVNNCITIGLDYKIIVIDTGGDIDLSRYPSSKPLILKKVSPIPRLYASVMWEKLNEAKPFCDDKTVLMNFDDDYSVNKYALLFTDKIMKENPEIDYLSLLKEPRMINNSGELLLSGFRFSRQPSCMGGSMIVRYRPFVSQVEAFFNEYWVTGNNPGTGGMFDVPFWEFLKNRYGLENVVYTTSSFSLTQHNNLVSSYLATKRDKFDFMSGLDYMPRTNPFELIK